ncbi:MAG: DUF433 domain-containing protein [Bacteroidota bacterium]
MDDYMNYIEINPKGMFGKPVIKGTRITVEQILIDMAAQKTPDDLIESYPRLTKEGIWAALHFVAHAIKAERIYPIAA